MLKETLPCWDEWIHSKKIETQCQLIFRIIKELEGAGVFKGRVAII